MYLSLKILCFASSNPQITNTDCWGCYNLSFFLSLKSKLFVWYSLPKRNDLLASVACIYSELIRFYHALHPWLIFCFVDFGFYVFLGFLKADGKHQNFFTSTDSGGVNYIEILLASIFHSLLVDPQGWVAVSHCTMSLKWNLGCQNPHLYTWKPEVSRNKFCMNWKDFLFKHNR